MENGFKKHITLNNLTYSAKNLDLLFASSENKNSWQNSIYFFLKNWFDESETVECHTSGSTGAPKKIYLKKSAMYHSAVATNAFFGLNSQTLALLCLPASYIAGKMMLVRAIAGEFNITCIEPSKNPFEKITFPVDFTAITPYQLINSAESLKNAKVKTIIVGGGQLNLQVENIANSLNSEVYETYGMTETASHIALRRVNGSKKSDFFTLLGGVSICTDESRRLMINAPYVSDKILVTNDLAEVIDSRKFRWLGRVDRVINSGGIKIYPEQLEKKLEDLITQNYFIGSLPDKIFGEKPVLLIENMENSDDYVNFLQKYITQRFTKYERPKEIIFIPEFIYSESGKILRRETMESI